MSGVAKETRTGKRGLKRSEEGQDGSFTFFADRLDLLLKRLILLSTVDDEVVNHCSGIAKSKKETSKRAGGGECVSVSLRSAQVRVLNMLTLGIRCVCKVV